MYEKMYFRISSFSFESFKRISLALLVEISINEGIGSRGVAVQGLYVEYEEGWEYKKMYSRISSFSLKV
jgi:hypothetical protein